ncbi:TIGR02444 family protein [Halomonas koreensis]|uniref:TIGR02444 family protein n=1 Tax=Halomonas koreensis TaxID=245385 RepID=A0ABU1G0J1_9GAMM|nr:TIGR02444 family protein [Halomonas koreensis]MDR5866394.1 TIGR02444 family protein [Halomonas koreensis]
MSADSTELSPTLRARLADDPLWDFALDLYARPGVEAACLRLQDEAGLEALELLWRAWLYRHGLAAGPFPEAVRRWQAEITAPLRRLRRDLKAEAEARAGVAALRERLKVAELEAEREALSRLAAHSLAGHGLRPLSSPPPACREVLAHGTQLLKKSHFLALETLAGQLDPS